MIDFFKLPDIAVVQTAYSALQAGLTSIQHRHPELASTILKVQKVGMVADAAALIENYRQLYHHAKERLEWFDIIAFGAAVALGTLKLQQLLKPTSDLKEILKKVVSLSAQDLEAVRIDWNAPLIQKVSSWLYGQRIVTHLALAFFSSKERILNLTSAAFQTVALCNISTLSWIQIEKSFPNLSPKQLSVSAFFLIPSSSHCCDIESHFQSAVKTIYNYMTKLFKDGYWSNSYWLITKRGGMEIRRIFVHDLIINETPLQPCDCKFTPFLSNLSAKAKDAMIKLYRVARLETKGSAVTRHLEKI